MVSEQDRELVRLFFEEVWNKGNLDYIDKAYSSSIGGVRSLSPLTSATEAADSTPSVYRSAPAAATSREEEK